MGERQAPPVSAAAFFDAARALKREMTGEPLTQHDVDMLLAVIGAWGPAEAAPGAGEAAKALNPTALTDEAAFFALVRFDLGALTQPQVDGFQILLQAFAVAAWPIAYAAYGLATAWHETNKTMQPVREAYWLSEDWRKSMLKYYPWYGRGFVQLTWERNYVRADSELGLAGALLADPDMAMQPDIAAKIIVKGMAGGWFSGKSLADYLPAQGTADGRQFTLARYIVNGVDRAADIAEIALKFQDALTAGGWR
jgi:putative chitinase